MSENFSSKLTKFRKEKNISQIKLAENLDCSRAMISSWENGKGIPPRESIVDIGRVLKLSADEIDDLLKLAGYELLTGEEVVRQVTNNVFSLSISPMDADFRYFPKELSRFFDSTGSYIGGTIDALDKKINAMENSLGYISASVIDFKSNQTIDLANEIEEK